MENRKKPPEKTLDKALYVAPGVMRTYNFATKEGITTYCHRIAVTKERLEGLRPSIDAAMGTLVGSLKSAGSPLASAKLDYPEGTSFAELEVKGYDAKANNSVKSAVDSTVKAVYHTLGIEMPKPVPWGLHILCIPDFMTRTIQVMARLDTEKHGDHI